MSRCKRSLQCPSPAPLEVKYMLQKVSSMMNPLLRLQLRRPVSPLPQPYAAAKRRWRSYARISSSRSACVFGRGFSFSACLPLPLAGLSTSIRSFLARATLAAPPAGAFATFLPAAALAGPGFDFPSRDARTSPGLPFFFRAARCLSRSLGLVSSAIRGEARLMGHLQLLLLLLAGLAALGQPREQLEAGRLSVVLLRCRLGLRHSVLLRLLHLGLHLGLHRRHAARDRGRRRDRRVRMRRGEDMVDGQGVRCC